jgi:hypothetical protein
VQHRTTKHRHFTLQDLLLLVALAVLAGFFSRGAHADTVVATVTAPTTGGPVASYELFMDGALLPGTAKVGANSFPNLVQPGTSHTYRVDTINASGRTKGDDVIANSPVLVPGKAGLTIIITQP